MTTNQENNLSDENIRPEIANMPVEQMEAIVENHTPSSRAQADACSTLPRCG